MIRRPGHHSLFPFLATPLDPPVKHVCDKLEAVLPLEWKKPCGKSREGVFTKEPFQNSFELILKQHMEKVWEPPSHTFPPHYTPR